MPQSPVCPFCGTTVEARQLRSFGHCGARGCIADASTAARAAIDAARGRQVEARRAELRECTGLDLAGPVPRVTAPLVPPCPERVAAFRAAVAEVIADVFARPIQPAAETPGAAIDPLSVAACTACRGQCCEGGERNNAFINDPVIARFRARHRDATKGDTLGHYMRLIPDSAVEGSCLFHGPEGCTIPREDRSATCNDHVCGALRQILETGAANPGAEIALGAFDAEGNLREIRRARAPEAT